MDRDDDDEEEDDGLLGSSSFGSGHTDTANGGTGGGGMSLQEMFDAAVKVIHCLPKDGPYQPSNSTKLRFYSLYKQATEGKSTQPQPSFFNMVNRAKWDAWNSLGDMDREVAKKQYIDELKNIVETMSMSGEVQNFLEAINPFYEFVSDRDEVENEKKSRDPEAWAVSCSSTSESCSSASTSNQNTPGHVTKIIQNGWNSRNGNLVHTAANGHLGTEDDEPDKDDLEDPPLPCNKMEGHHAEHRLVSSFQPPAAPVHRRSITATLPLLESDLISSSPSNSDEVVLKVDVDLTGRGEQWGNSTLHARFSAENLLHSGTESEKYYSGDSEPEAEVELRPPAVDVLSAICSSRPQPYPSNSIFSIPAARSSSGSSSPGINERGDCQQPHLNLVLQHTVERLNRDVDHILARIRLLEAAYATNEQFGKAAMAVTERRQRRSIFGLTPQALTLILTWPVVVFFVTKLIKLWLIRRRRLNG